MGAARTPGGENIDRMVGNRPHLANALFPDGGASGIAGGLDAV